MMTVVAIDLGATNLRAALFKGEQVVKVQRTRTPRTSGSELIEAMISLARSVSEGEKVDAIGIASIGPLDIRKGMLLWAPNLGYGNVPMRDAVGQELKAPTYLTNDALAGAWAEKVLGQGRNISDLAYITMSTGLGVGAVVDGNLLVGRRGNAHELGHSVINFDSELPCGCGGVGHWEAHVGGKNIPHVAQELSRQWKGQSTKAYELALEGKLGPEQLYSSAREGDAFAQWMVDYLNKAHAAGIMTVIAAYDPEVIFIGGSIYLYNEDLIRPGVIKYLQKFVGVFGVPDIRKCSFGDDQVLYGAAAIAFSPPPAIARDAYRP